MPTPVWPPRGLPPVQPWRTQGVTVTCCGPNVLAALGVARTDLLQSSISLFAAIKSKLSVWGALSTTLISTSKGKSYQTEELMYVVQDLSGLYLSKDALASLGSIPGSSPSPPLPEAESGRHDGSAEVCRLPPETPVQPLLWPPVAVRFVLMQFVNYCTVRGK